jgi:hypothetical protein
MVMRWRFSDAIWLSAANVAYEACWQLNRTFHVYEFVFIGALLLALPNPAFANWWIVRASDKQCLVVDIEPTGKDKSVTKIGKTVYPTREKAEADVKRLCKQ